MTPLTPAALADLRRLLDAATPGPWVQRFNRCAVFARHRPGTAGRIWPNPDGGADVDSREAEANASLVAALRNAAPAILDELDTLRAENARLRGIVAMSKVPSVTVDSTVATENAALRAELAAVRAKLDALVEACEAFVTNPGRHSDRWAMFQAAIRAAKEPT